MSSRMETEDSEPDQLKPEGLRLPDLTARQMERGLADLRRLNRQELENIAALVSNTDPRLLETVFRAQGIEYSAEDIAKLAAVLTSASTVERIASIADRKSQAQREKPDLRQKPDLSQKIARRLQKDPKHVEKVLRCLHLLTLPVRGGVQLVRALMTGSRKFYFIPAVVGLVCYAVTQLVAN